MTPQETSTVLAMLMAAYPNARVPDGTIALYESFLAGFDRDRCVLAVRKIITTSKFMPTIAEIVSAYEGQGPTGSGDGEAPYHRRFRPKRGGNVMKPAELASAISEYLAGSKPKGAA